MASADLLRREEEVYSSLLDSANKGDGVKSRSQLIEKKIEALEDMATKVSNRRSRKWLNDRLLIELVPRLHVEQIKGLFAPPPWGEELPMSAFCRTSVGEWDAFRSIDMDTEARLMQHMKQSSEKQKMTRVDEDEMSALNAWHRIDCQTREAIKRNFRPELLEIYEERVRTFIEDTGDKDVLVLNVQDPFQRLLLHGVCEFYNVTSTTTSGVRDGKPWKTTTIKKRVGTCVPSRITLVSFLALPDLGLASGDLIYFTLSPLWVPTPPAQAPAPNPSRGSASIAKAADRGKSTEQSGAGGSSSQVHAMDVNPSVPMASDPAPVDVVMVEAIDPSKTWSSFVLRDLKREMEYVGGAEGTVVGRLVAALHAALLDVGFRSANPMGCHLSLPQDWPSGASAPLIIKYTLPEFVAMVPVAEEGKVAMLNFSLMGNFITVYGYVPGVQSEMPRLCLALPRLEPLLYLDSNQLCQMREELVLELWRVLKNEMCLPLMISLCQQNNLGLPPCLMALPADLKTKILEFVPGEDLARVECTCKEMRTLAADGNLWKKFTSKAKFAEAWTAKKRRQKRPSPSFWNYGWGNPPFVPHRFPVIGGEMDRLPFVGNHGYPGRIFGNQRRNMSPNCNLNDSRRSFF